MTSDVPRPSVETRVVAVVIAVAIAIIVIVGSAIPIIIIGRVPED